MALDTLIAGLKYCIAVIVVDVTYLNGHYGVTIFTVCTQDANIFMLTFGIEDNENDSLWTWFLNMMKRSMDRDTDYI